MSDRDDVNRELARCVECGSVYAARQWPTGKIQPIGSDSCDCGCTEFTVVTDHDGDASGGRMGAE